MHYKQSFAYVLNLRSRASLAKKKDELLKRLIQATSLKREALSKISMHLSDIDPKNLLKKGFTILFSEIDHSIILSVKELQKNQKIIAQLCDGTIRANVEDVIQP